MRDTLSCAFDSFVHVLVGLLNHESNPDIMLLAARALTHLCDVLPSSCAAVVHYGAVSCFCIKHYGAVSLLRMYICCCALWCCFTLIAYH